MVNNQIEVYFENISGFSEKLEECKKIE